MRRPDSRYIVLWLFLFGIIIVLFLQVISGYNINRLIGGNKSLRNELQVQNDLRTVEVDLFLIESNVRGVIITGNEKLLAQTSENNKQIEQQLHQLIQDLQSKIPRNQLDRLTKLAQEKIRESESRFRFLFESNVLGVAFWEMSGTVYDANDAFLDLLGYTKKDMEEGQVNWRKFTLPE